VGFVPRTSYNGVRRVGAGPAARPGRDRELKTAGPTVVTQHRGLAIMHNKTAISAKLPERSTYMLFVHAASRNPSIGANDRTPNKAPKVYSMSPRIHIECCK